MTTFIEATVVYREVNGDPRDPASLRSQKRLLNTADISVITPTTDGKGHTIFHMRQPSTPPLLVVLEPYEYWTALLTSTQARLGLGVVIGAHA